MEAGGPGVNIQLGEGSGYPIPFEFSVSAPSDPVTDSFKIVNMYVDTDTEKLVIEYDNKL